MGNKYITLLSTEYNFIKDRENLRNSSRENLQVCFLT
jgi:hypothetical protein